MTRCYASKLSGGSTVAFTVLNDGAVVGVTHSGAVLVSPDQGVTEVQFNASVGLDVFSAAHIYFSIGSAGNQNLNFPVRAGEKIFASVAATGASVAVFVAESPAETVP